MKIEGDIDYIITLDVIVNFSVHYFSETDSRNMMNLGIWMLGLGNL